MFASLALAAFASVAVAAPIDSTVLASIENSLKLPNTTQTNAAVNYYQNGNAGACGLYSKDSDLVVGLPLEFYSNLGSVSPYCGSYVVVKSLANNETVTSRVADASATNETLSLSMGTWNALNGDNTDLTTVTWRFANATEVAAAKAALAAGSSSSSSSSAAPAASSSSSAPAAESPAAVAKTSSSSSPVTTTKAYSPPAATTTSTKQWTQTTTTQAWTPTTTTQAPAKTQAAKSNSGSGSYSGQATWYTQNGNPGACGNYNSDSAYIVAIDSAMYNGGANCGKQVTIYGNGKSVTATVADECPTCASSGSLDLSTAAFQALASLDAGVVSITWSFS